MAKSMIAAAFCVGFCLLSSAMAQGGAAGTPASGPGGAPTSAPAGGARALPAVKIEGGYDNAQIAGIRVEEASAESPRVVIGGTIAVEGVPEKTRDHNRFIHWNFRLSGCKGRTVRFELYLDKANSWTMRTVVPVVRYADGTVELIRGIEVKSYGPAEGRNMEKVAGFFSHRFRSEPAQVSYCLPFTNETAGELAAELKANKTAAVIGLGKTPLFNLPVWQFVVTDPNVPDKDKKGVWLYSCEDPWEFPGTYALAGFVRFAAGDDPLAAEFRKRFVLSAIPLVNPDAVHRGDTNFYLDPGGRNIINTGLSWKRTDIAPHELIKAAMRKWKADGRSLDLMTSMHSSCFWSAVLRIDWAHDSNVARRFIDEVYAKKYIPWAAGKGMASAPDMSGTLGASLGAELWPDRLLYFGQHLEEIVMPRAELLGTAKVRLPEELQQDILPCQPPEDLLAQGELFARAVCEFYGVKVPAEKVPPFLMCGLVDRYWAAGGTPLAYTVLYRDTEGRAAKFVRLQIGGKTIEMKAAAGADPVKGVLYTATEKLVEGDNGYSFTASNGAMEIRYPKKGAFPGAYAVK